MYFIWRNLRLRLYKSSLHYFLIHIAVTHTLASALILPTSLAILLSRYWIFGDFMCYTLTMVQDLPSRVVLLLFVLIAIDRYRQFGFNALDALPRHGCVVGIWLISSALAFPACIFVEFYDMYYYFKLDMLRGIGLCVVNNHSMEEYARAMFVVVYVVPLAVFAFAFTRISVELPRQEQPVILAHLSTTPTHRDANGFGEEWPLSPGAMSLDNGTVNADVERRIQRYLTACGVMVAVSSLPLNVMSVIQFGLTEDYADKSAMYDVTYAIFVWISFFPTVCTPALCLGMMSVAGCPIFYRLLKRWREGSVGTYVRRFSDFASTSAAGIVRLYPRMGANAMMNSSDTTMTILRQRSQSIISSRSTAITALAVGASATNSALEKRHFPEESVALMQLQPAPRGGRRQSMAATSDTERAPQRRSSLAISFASPTGLTQNENT